MEFRFSIGLMEDMERCWALLTIEQKVGVIKRVLTKERPISRAWLKAVLDYDDRLPLLRARRLEKLQSPTMMFKSLRPSASLVLLDYMTKQSDQEPQDYNHNLNVNDNMLNMYLGYVNDVMRVVDLQMPKLENGERDLIHDIMSETQFMWSTVFNVDGNDRRETNVRLLGESEYTDFDIDLLTPVSALYARRERDLCVG
jgi:hypothetical protein